MATAKQYLSEVVRAAVVLALVLFALGAAPPEQVGASPAVTIAIAQAAAAEFCGGVWGDKQAAHAPCHACRTGVPMLPAPPLAAVPAFAAAARFAYIDVAPVALPAGPPRRPSSRAPPAVA